MDPHAHGRNRPVNVALRPFLSQTVYELIRVTGWQGESSSLFCDDRVIGCSPERGNTDDPGRYAVEYLFHEVFSKFDDGKPSKTKDEATWAKFHLAEDTCKETNLRLSRTDPLLCSTTGVGVYSLIEAAKRKISYALGPLDLEELHDGMCFTHGASFALPRTAGHQAYKFSGKKETTFGNLAFAMACIMSSPLWQGRPIFGEGPVCNPLNDLEVVDGNKLISVPKNYKTDRTIAVEPRMNMFVQKGFGNLIRRRLKRVGIDLDHGQETNRDLAFFGSSTGYLATIDLSMASDTVSLELVRQLLPPDWLHGLEQSRSLTGVLPSGEKILYRKFSSMGNGYTFELETLIFWALCTAVADAYGASSRLIAVYGDDIIVPASVASPVIELLKFCGFVPNEKKTFVEGPFRESCGKHYFRGVDVTPFYVKSEDSSLLGLFKLHNQLKRWFLRLEREGYHFPGSSELLERLRNRAPRVWRRPRIPDGYGDGAFIGSFDECVPSRPVSSPNRNLGAGWEGWYVVVLSETARHESPIDLLIDRRRSRHVLTPNGVWAWHLSRKDPGRMSHLCEPIVRGGVVRSRRVRQIQIIVPHF